MLLSLTFMATFRTNLILNPNPVSRHKQCYHCLVSHSEVCCLLEPQSNPNPNLNPNPQLEVCCLLEPQSNPNCNLNPNPQLEVCCLLEPQWKPVCGTLLGFGVKVLDELNPCVRPSTYAYPLSLMHTQNCERGTRDTRSNLILMAGRRRTQNWTRGEGRACQSKDIEREAPVFSRPGGHVQLSRLTPCVMLI